jgi:predicted dehydrogenase
MRYASRRFGHARRNRNAAAQAGKHVLVEKPVDISVERIDDLIAACDSANVRLGAIFQARFGVGAIAAKKAVAQGRLGRMTHASACVPWYRSQEYYASSAWRGTWDLDGGGALMNQAFTPLTCCCGSRVT